MSICVKFFEALLALVPFSSLEADIACKFGHLFSANALPVGEKFCDETRRLCAAELTMYVVFHFFIPLA